jgi:hypothetical protein
MLTINIKTEVLTMRKGLTNDFFLHRYRYTE